MKNTKTASLSLRKLLLSALVAAPLATLPGSLWALPASQSALNTQINNLSSGVTATWVDAARVNITSSANYSVIKWNDFGAAGMTIGAGDRINYTLPSSSASLLNMVVGGNATTVNGLLDANGILYILNPNGITIGATGQIVANGVGLSTIPESDYQFLTSGTLSYIATTPATAAITLASGSEITAASGTGNVLITGAGTNNLAGTIDGGTVTVNTQNNGNVVLGAGGSLTVGNTFVKNSTLAVTTTGTGTITVGDGVANSNVAVFGPSATLTTANQTISQAGTGYLKIGAGGTVDSTLTMNAGTANITLTDANNNNGNKLTVSATGAAVNVQADSGKLAIGGTMTNGLTASTGAGDLTLNASTVTGAVAATAVAGNILSGGNVNATTGVNLTVDNTKNITFAGKSTAGGINVAASAGSINNVTLTGTAALDLTAMSIAGALSATASGNITQSAAQTAVGNVTINSTGGSVVLSQTITAPRLSVTSSTSTSVTAAQDITTAATFNAGTTLALGTALRAGGAAVTTISATAGTDLTTTGAINGTTSTYSAGGALAFNSAITAPTLTATGTTITQTAGNIITSTGTATIDGITSITLGNANALTNLVLKRAPSGATVGDTDGVVLASGTNTTGNVTINASLGSAGNVVLGAAAADTLTFGGNLTIDNDATANGNISDASDKTSVTGTLTLLVGGTGTVDLNGNAGNAIGLTTQYGQVNITTAGGDARIFEQTSLNLGAINLGAGDLAAYSLDSIVNTGRLQITDALVGAGTATAPGSIALNYTHATTPNTINGTVTVQTDLGLLGLGTIGNYLASSLSVAAGSTLGGATSLVSVPVNVYSAGMTGPITVSTSGAAPLVLGEINTTGAVTLTSGTGPITATNANNVFTNVTVTTGNTTAATSTDVTVKGNLTVNGTISGSRAANFTAGFGVGQSGSLTIGSFTSSNTAATTFTANGTGKTITDSVSGIAIFGPVTFTGPAVSITKTGHNFGGVTIDTSASNGAATILESGYLRLVSVKTGSGAFTATSSVGNIIQTNGVGSGIVSTGAVTLNASAGAVVVDDTNNDMTGAITLTATGNSTIKNIKNTSLGDVTVSNGNFAVDVSAANKTISQASGKTINAYGASSFLSGGSAITLGNTGNRFGALTLTSGGGNVTVKEQTTMNLASVNTGGGNLTATSDGGSIIDSGAVVVTGTATFSASSGSITIDHASGSFGTVALTTTSGNATVVDSVGNLVLGTTTVGGTLDVTNSTGNITQSGVLDITGDTTILATLATSSLTLDNTSNRFGAFRFRAGTGGTLIRESTTFNLKGGSNATGPVTIETLGDFVTSGSTASFFTGNVTINAIGTIVPSTNSLSITGTFTVISNNAKNLSALSLSGNLFGNNPVNQGTGAYTAPSP